MMRAFRAAMALSVLLVKVAVCLVGLIMLIGAVIPSSPPEGRIGSGAGGAARPRTTVVLSVPEGHPAAYLVVVDASGRELATLTHWANGRTALTTRHHVGPTLGYHRDAAGSLDLLVTGSAAETQIRVRPDGTTKTAASEPSRFINPPLPTGPKHSRGSGHAPTVDVGRCQP